jgi:Mid domain of argonaute
MSSGAYLPMECIDTQPVRVTKITDEQRAALCTMSSLQPTAYALSIDEVRKDPNQQCSESDPFIAAWNLNVMKDMLTIPARVLPPPTIVCNERFKVTHDKGTKKGVWNHSRTQFYKPKQFPKVWGLINLSKSMNYEACERFYHELEHVAQDRGMQCPAPLIVKWYDSQKLSILELIDELRILMLDNRDCQFYFIILPEDDGIRDPIYAAIKELVR